MGQRTSRRTFLKRSLALAAGCAAPACVLDPRAAIAWTADEPLDVAVTGGTVIDGSGDKRFGADVGIRGGRIVTVGKLPAVETRRTIDAAGRVVCPGFIDMHTHSDRTLLRDGTAHSAVRQGATTHVTGNCGSSPAPRAEKETGENAFATFGRFVEALRDEGCSINVAALAGHNAVRAAVMGYANRAPTESELKRMRDHVDEAMRSGAVGMSTGLVSPPGTYSQTGEIIELARIVAEHRGLYASHIRGEAGSLVEAVAEAIRIGREAGLPVEISHHKAAGKENWGKTRVTLAMIEKAVERGQRVRVDVYPYRAGSAGLAQLVPPWAHEGGRAKMLQRLADPDTRARVIRDMTRGSAGWPNFFRVDWNDIQITSVAGKQNRRWVGRRVAEVAEARGCSGVEACLDLLIEEQGRVGMINFIMDEFEMRRVLAHPLSMVGSDGTAVAKSWAEGQPHPRYYGCYPRVLGRYVREAGLLSLETAIHKMTAMPAAQLGLPDRGLLEPGCAADLVVFDPETVIDRATFEDPHQYPVGIDHVLVNGQVVVAGGEHTGARPGQVLRPQRG